MYQYTANTLITFAGIKCKNQKRNDNFELVVTLNDKIRDS